jgi:hypothetical protein
MAISLNRSTCKDPVNFVNSNQVVRIQMKSKSFPLPFSLCRYSTRAQWPHVVSPLFTLL